LTSCLPPGQSPTTAWSIWRRFGVKPGRYVKISVTDTGIGMDDDIQQRVFDPFFTNRDIGRGTGLGLASSYGIVMTHQGIINVYSESGKGSTFNIFLPAGDKNMLKTKAPSVEILKGKERILFIDDEDIIIDVGERILVQLGYDVVIAQSGQDALEIYQKEHNQIDLVILDMILPGISGEDIFEKLQALNPNVKVLLSSGYSLNGQAAKILERGCNGFIQKPFAIADMSQKIRNILDQK
ncbi:response regulator, partial [Thermodesulfobacteriota bacterium]